MEKKDIVKRVLKDYQSITGLRSYAVYEHTVVQSASEKNYFCKCLKSSSKALKKCEECTEETYNNARNIEHECIYSCHAGLIKWAVPVKQGDFRCVIVSEGVLAEKQKEEADKWVSYLSEEYRLNADMLLKNFKVIKTMNEEQMNASIELLKDLLSYHFAMEENSAH